MPLTCNKKGILKFKKVSPKWYYFKVEAIERCFPSIIVLKFRTKNRITLLLCTGLILQTKITNPRPINPKANKAQFASFK